MTMYICKVFLEREKKDYQVYRSHTGSYYLIHPNMKLRYRYEPWDITDVGGIIFLLRNYKECIVRNAIAVDAENDDANWMEDLDGWFERCTRNKTPSLEFVLKHGRDEFWDYIEVLDKFDRFQGPKVLLYYEDFVTNPESCIEKIGRTMGVQEPIVNGVAKHGRQLFRDSFDEYPVSITNGTPSDLIYHSKLLSEAQRINWDRRLESSYPNLFGRYLSRYKEQDV